jgi:putative redox protein
MIEVHVKHEDGVKFEIEARGHKVISDQPQENGGQDAGMTPPELFLSGLASCAAFYAVAYLKKKKIERPGVTVRATAEKAGPPAHLAEFRIEVDVPGDLSDADRAGVEDSVHRCLIHQTMLQTPTIEIAVRTPVTA